MAYSIKNITKAWEIPQEFEVSEYEVFVKNIMTMMPSNVELISTDSAYDGISMINMPNTNSLFIVHLILKIEKGVLPKNESDLQIKKFEDAIEMEMENYLNSKNVIFNQIEIL